MDQRPLFLGRGRGRGQAGHKNAIKASPGRSQPNIAGSSAWSKPQKVERRSTGLDQETSPSKERIQAANRIKESAKKFVDSEGFDESSSDEEVNDEDILTSTLKIYKDATQGMISSHFIKRPSKNTKIDTAVSRIARASLLYKLSN